MLKINKERLVMQSVTGEVRHPRVRNNYVVNYNGEAVAVPSVQAICYNIRIGDSVYAFEGDHLEPAATIRNSEELYNNALNFLSCIGNKARVVTGDAKGEVGYVTGTHGGVEDVMVDFPREVLEKMVPGDKVLVQSVGQGLKLLDYPEVKAMNVDPDLLLSLNIEEKDGKLHVPVVAEVPAHLMGSGLGSNSAYSGDYDIMTMDEGELEKHKLTNLKFGDLVYLRDCDTTFGRGFLKGAGTVGVIIHGNCILAGHGPGVTTILASKTDVIVPKIVEKSNISEYIFQQYK